MRTAILFLLLAFCFASCRKEALVVQPATTVQKTVPDPDTIPDRAGLKIKLYQDSIGYDDTMFLFDHRFNRDYNPSADAAYMPGMGQVSLASISGDGRDLAVYTLPYRRGMSVGLDFHTKTSGKFYITLSYKNKIPQGLHIWLRDAYRKDSVNICAAADTFIVNEADTNSFGNRRFSLVFGEKRK